VGGNKVLCAGTCAKKGFYSGMRLGRQFAGDVRIHALPGKSLLGVM
jgi:hypothetical protein